MLILRNWALLGLLTIATQAPLTAQVPAFRGSLSEYLSLGEDGVQISKTTFHHFRLLPLQAGAGGFSSRFITVVPITGINDKPGFRFEIMDGATVDDFLELRFAFDVSGPGLAGARISLQDVTVRSSSDGGADVLLDLKVTGSGSQTFANLITFAAPGGIGMLQDEVEFSPRENFTVEVDAVIDGGSTGNSGVIVASIGSVTVSFTESIPLAEPVVHRSGLSTSNTYFIEFTSTPSTPHTVRTSATLDGGFTLPEFSIVTDASGFARIEINLSSLPLKAFFQIQQNSL